MKKILATFALLSGTLFAADTSLTFPERKIELPSLSLTESARYAPSPLNLWSQAGDWFRHQALPAVVEQKKLVSRMPIVVPKADIDPKLLKAPDSSVDFKLIVKSPGVVPAK